MPTSLKLVFCGTPAFAVPALHSLHAAKHHIALVVTQPDRPSGRGLNLIASPVKQVALSLGLPIKQPDRIKNSDEFRQLLNDIHPDAIIVVGYGRIIPRWMIDLPRLGNINLHSSLLPKYRGAAPVQWAIAKGETETGVTTMLIDAGLDTGDILLQERTAINLEDTAETLGPKLAEIGGDLLVETLDRIQEGTMERRSQDHAEASLAPILKKEDGRIDFSRTAQEVCNRMRGFTPWPGAFTIFRGKSLHIWKAQACAKQIPPGILSSEQGRLFAGCGADTAIEIFELQLEGKKRMPAAAFINGYPPLAHEMLGQ